MFLCVEWLWMLCSGSRKSFLQFLPSHTRTQTQSWARSVFSSRHPRHWCISQRLWRCTRREGKLLRVSICQIHASCSLPVLISGARGNAWMSHSLLCHLHTFLNPYITHYFYTLLLYPSFGLGEANLVLFPPFLNKNGKKNLQVRPSRENSDSLSAFSEAGDNKASITWWRSAGRETASRALCIRHM